MSVALISTLRNEGGSIRVFLDSILGQTRTPDEIIITDGGSTDATCTIIESYIAQGHPIRLIRLPGANRSVGRNAGIRAAQADIIAVTDAGCKLSRDWLERITTPFGEGAHAVAGFYLASPETPLEACIGAMTIPGPGSVNPGTFLPSSRSVAFTKEAWRRAGGYPEHLDLNEDTPFDLRLLGAGYRFVFKGDALVYWRPRRTVDEVYRQFRSYARGDGQAGILGRVYGGIFARYLLAISGLCISLAFGGWWMLLSAVALVPGVHRVWRDYSKVGKKLRDSSPWPLRRSYAGVLPVRLAIDFGDMEGYLRGLIDKYKNGWNSEGG